MLLLLLLLLLLPRTPEIRDKTREKTSGSTWKEDKQKMV
jgi:hypothetical protein